MPDEAVKLRAANDFAIRIVYRNKKGNIEAEYEEYTPADFGGCIPNVGDKIISPLISKRDAASQDWLNPDLRDVYEVEARYFWPRRNQNYVALLISSRRPKPDEVDLL